MGVMSSPSQGFVNYIKQHKYEIYGYIIATVIVGTGLVLLQEQLKGWLFPEKEAALELKRVSSSVAGFPTQQSIEVIQLLVYEISASDLVEEIKVTANFKKDTSIIRQHVLYSIDVEGYASTPPQLENWVEFS
jgi:hypothetical protein